MPLKIREIKQRLKKLGFEYRTGKGSHTVWTHPKLNRVIVISGNDGDDAKPYQEKELKKAIEAIQEQ